MIGDHPRDYRPFLWWEGPEAGAFWHQYRAVTFHGTYRIHAPYWGSHPRTDNPSPHPPTRNGARPMDVTTAPTYCGRGRNPATTNYPQPDEC